MIEATDCFLVMGRRGCGKSYLAKRIQEMFPRRVIIDTLNEYRNEGIVIHSFAGFAEKLTEFKEKNLKDFVLIYQFPVESDVNKAEFNQIMRLCYYFGGIQIVIEEVQLHCSTQWLPHWLRQNLLVGRHQKLSLLFTSQRPGEVNKTIVSQCHHVFCGNLIDGNDLKYVSNFLNQDANKLVTLPDRQFIYFNKGEISQISNDF